MHRKGRPANRLPLSCAFFSLMRYLEYDSTVNSNRRVRKVIGSVNIWILIYVRYNQQVIRRIGSRKQRQPAQMISCHR